MIVRCIIIVLLMISFSSLLGQESNQDTLMAHVQYGNKRVLDHKFYSVKDKDRFLDSVLIANEELKEDLDFLKKFINQSNANRIIAIDSLLDHEKVRYDLINELENMIFYISEPDIAANKKMFDFTGDSEIPSSKLYSQWNTKLFKNNCDIKSDSSYLISLVEKDHGSYTHPVCITSLIKYKGLVTSKQGWRDGKRHNGVDIQMDQWDSVLCIFDGKVRFVKEYEGYGRVVVVRHFNGLETIYAHLAKFKVKPGQNIKSGDLIGLAGNTGNSEGSHLHFEIRFKDQVLNPENIIDFKNNEIKSEVILLKKTGVSFVAVPKSEPVHYIERGDYPHRIASRYGMNVDYFCKLNNITSKTKLKVGETVVIE